jgi:iron complex transport system substrate-binding protein
VRGLLFIFLIIFCSCAVRKEAPAKQIQAAESAGETEIIVDALGRRYVLNKKPERIVSLNPSVTEILFAIGAGTQVVGVTQYCDYPPEALAKTKVGGFSGATVSVEQIRILNPDLVILSADMHQRIISLLDSLSIPSFAVEPRNISQVYDTIALLGEITGCETGASELSAYMKTRIARVTEAVQNLERPGVFWIISEDPLMTAGKSTFISEIIRLGGGKNIFEDVDGDWPLISPEQVLFRKPEWVLLGDDMMDAEAFLKKPFWQNINAVREGRSKVISASVLYRYGPRLADGVETIAKILHPGAL